MRDVLVETPTGSLAVRDYGGAGPQVLLLHGAGHNLEIWRHVIEAIDGAARVVAVDLRGHGQSCVDASFTLADLADDVHRVCTALRMDSPILVGHSLGGWAALAAASGADITALVVVEGPVVAMRKLYEALDLPPGYGLDELSTNEFHGDDAAWRKRVDKLSEPGSVGRAVLERACLRGSDGLLHSHPLTDELLAAQRCTWQLDPAVAYQHVDAPIRLVLGTEVDVPRPRRYAKLRRAALDDFDRVQVTWLPGGHHLPVDCPQAVADVVRSTFPG
ncbi:alpha/beta fold hydrolase [Skermania sp. ID1734]|uniref:alpha/beta fold hydrolase n=1 Tax=Skermania sp. ID1734 TaxID=2597516 RepID=UPI00163DC938|nr:alpha/beta hydrolase [Skermania sp. ID1734]